MAETERSHAGLTIEQRWDSFTRHWAQDVGQLAETEQDELLNAVLWWAASERTLVEFRRAQQR